MIVIILIASGCTGTNEKPQVVNQQPVTGSTYGNDGIPIIVPASDISVAVSPNIDVSTIKGDSLPIGKYINTQYIYDTITVDLDNAFIRDLPMFVSTSKHVVNGNKIIVYDTCIYDTISNESINKQICIDTVWYYKMSGSNQFCQINQNDEISSTSCYKME